MGNKQARPAPCILVTGANSAIGTAVIRAVKTLCPDATVRAGVRVIQQNAFADSDVHVVVLDTSNVETLSTAFSGVNRVFITTPTENRVETTLKMAQAAKDANVDSIVYVSSMILKCSEYPSAVEFQEMELQMAALDIQAVALRCGLLMENMVTLNLEHIRCRDLLKLPCLPRTEIAQIAAADVARAAAKILLRPKRFKRRHYSLTGPAAISCERIVSSLSAALSRTVQFRTMPFEVICEEWIENGVRASVAKSLMEHYKAAERNVVLRRVTKDVQRITGKRPLNTSVWIRDHVQLFL